MAKARSMKQEQGRQEILMAAAGLLAAHGYHGMSMRDLARSTGMSLANLYNYFRAKEDVVFELQCRAFDSLIATAEEAVGSAVESDERLYAFVLNHVRYVVAHTDVLRVLVEEAGELPPSRRRIVRDLKERYFEIGRDAVRAVVENAGVRGRVAAASSARSELEVERSTYNIFGMLNWIYGWYRADRHGTAQDVARTIHRLATCGLTGTTPRGSMLSGTELRAGRIPVVSPIVGVR